ncbi:choice-of-anchor L domain-containing protein [Paracrocinitomix mangrovi]|uniref:choice-of-anchor L domain-containing protein n=1 Tax=Paracrocinitomix mangrovi TaxID=2862509 RepID=UPI001C8D92DA|nr:choice-of-anchor L domain-containing protein [Paracrocinitomix mangrovi]UKN00894.1 choice-of-anchor L domain-containing protein [Paracrocinitomix mangrovi]
MKKLVYILLSLMATFIVGNTYAQLTTSNAATPTQLVENTLVGNGVAVSNVVYTGNAEAIGSFNGANTNLGLASGVILTTGTVLNTGGILGGSQGPHGPNDSGSAGVDNGNPGYSPLTSLAGADTYNAAVLEFDFVPQSDTVKFRYVFGSEEYPEYVDGGFNDAFAFFISGPGILGTQNMATIPGGGGIVSIDNINNGNTNSGPCQNCAYYINNGTGSTAPQNGSDFYIQYDGFTVVMEAISKVQCGQTYHLVIAIADAGDGAYDSGIFLEANSLESFAPIDMSYSLALDGYGDNYTMAEGCETATVTVSRPSNNAQDAITIPVMVSGTATEGVDYSNVPASINFASGQTSVSFDLDVFSDGISEGTESVIIQLNQPDPCGNNNFITIELAIQDVNPLQATIPDVDVHCPGEDAVLEVQVTGGLEPYTYSWGVGGSDDNITVNPTTTTSYDVTVNDACLQSPVTVSGTVNVPNYPPVIMVTSPDTSVLCPNTPQTLLAEATGGDGNFVYTWYQGTSVIGSGTSQGVSPMVTTTYTVGVLDGCGVEIFSDIIVTVEASVLELEMSPDQLVCPGDSAVIWVEASEGLGNYTYYWHHSGETTPEVTVWPNHTTTYTVSVEDECHTYHIDGQTVVEVVRPEANFNILTDEPMEDLLVSFQNTTNGGVTWYWDFGNGDNSTANSPNTTYDAAGWYDVTLIAYNIIGCSDTVTKPIYIKPEFYFYAPNAFTPDGNRLNNNYEVSVIGATGFEFQIFNRWGELIYATTDQYFKWDGNYDGAPVQDGVLVWRAKVVDREENVHTFQGHITILR